MGSRDVALSLPAALASWNAKVNEPFMNALGIAVNQFSNVVCTKILGHILSIKPVAVNRFLTFLPFGFASEGAKARGAKPAP